MWNLLLDVRGFTEGTPQSPAVTAPLKGSLIKASPERGGEPSQTVEGFLWNLLLDVRGFTEVPLSHLR